MFRFGLVGKSSLISLMRMNLFSNRNHPPLQTYQNIEKHFRLWILTEAQRNGRKKIKCKIPHCIPHFNYCDCCVSDGVYKADMHLNEIRSASKYMPNGLTLFFFIVLASWSAYFWGLILFLLDTSTKLYEFSENAFCFYCKSFGFDCVSKRCERFSNIKRQAKI